MSDSAAAVEIARRLAAARSEVFAQLAIKDAAQRTALATESLTRLGNAPTGTFTAASVAGYAGDYVTRQAIGGGGPLDALTAAHRSLFSGAPKLPTAPTGVGGQLARTQSLVVHLHGTQISVNGNETPEAMLAKFAKALRQHASATVGANASLGDALDYLPD